MLVLLAQPGPHRRREPHVVHRAVPGVPRMRREEAACERRNQQSNAVQEMEEGAEGPFPGPPGSALRERDSKPLQGASVKSGGLERCRKRQGNPCQVCTTELSESKPSDDASKTRNDDIRTRAAGMPWDEPGELSRSWPGGVRRKGGKNVVRALVRNSGTSRVVAPPETVGTGVRRGRKPKARVPDAAHWGGLGRSSDEGAVMALEQRPQPSCWTVWPIW